MSIELVPLSPILGVEIRGLDPHRLDAEAAAVFRKAFLDHHLVLLRDCALSEEEGVALTELLGPVSFAGANMKGGRKFTHISNIHADGRLPEGELLFHSDHMFFAQPLKAISLYALAAPSAGGETLFASAALAYDRLPASVKDRIAGLEARHLYDYGANAGNKRADAANLTDQAVSCNHPVVWTHPETAQPLLFVSRLFTDQIIGLPPAESDALLETLFQAFEDPEVCYAHKWRVGEYVVWDNRALQHARRDFAPTEKRAMRRVPIADTAQAA